MFEATFRIGVQVETDEQGQRAFPVTKQRPRVNESEFLALLASVYREQVYPALRAGDDLTVTAHLDAPTREVERTFRFREDRLFEGEGLQQPAAAHYFMRNRTHGSDFPPFFSAHDRSRPSFSVAFDCASSNGKGVFLFVARVRLLVKPLCSVDSASV
jgi:hypothetical protein